VLPQGDKQYSIYFGGKGPPKPRDYIVDIHGYYYDYYIPAGEIPRPPAIGPKPYARTLIILSPFDFIIPGAVPSDFARRPLIFVGVVVPQEIKNRETAGRPQTRGLAIIPLNANGRPDFAHAVTAPPRELLISRCTSATYQLAFRALAGGSSQSTSRLSAHPEASSTPPY